MESKVGTKKSSDGLTIAGPTPLGSLLPKSMDELPNLHPQQHALPSGRIIDKNRDGRGSRKEKLEYEK